MSSGELRQRNVPQNARAPSSDPFAMLNYDEAHLSASALLSASPVHSGFVMKIHVPALYTFLPATVQWFLSRCCPKSWSPTWKRRYLIALGEYMYRFKDEGGGTPKGSPIPVATTDVRIVSREDDDGIGELGAVFDMLPDDCNAIFEVSSIGKTQYFSVESREEAMIWVNSLRQMRQDAITRHMGHSKNIPYPKEWESFDASAKRLKDKKSRIKSKMEAMDKKEYEMRSLAGGGGSIGGYLS
mmetsp:Transcript_37694/g.79462  ORF Transcript_37694/g.79462 Transcript_37694/m.79462 type:complete len:242 (-) Transcript_37694:120-845(-)